MNKGLCNRCGKLVAASPQEKSGKVYLVKECPACGPTQTMIASDAKRYFSKRQLDRGYQYSGCSLTCTHCHHKDPNMVFLDITNRCNMNCPICINNTPSMGFLFEPPMEYFDKIFEKMAQYRPRPELQLFGGEPTLHDRLFEIIARARARRLSVRVVTNGLKLADEAFCRRLIESGATILIAYDGDNPELYTTLRGSKSALRLKQQAFDNISRIGGAKVGVMSLVAKDYNDHSLDQVFSLCHVHRDNVRGVYFMPLAHTWKDGKFDKEPERITPEDVETRVAEVYPNEPIDFIPAGIIGQLTNYLKYFRVRRVPFLGAHPNCESYYVLFSDGEKYQPLGRFLKHSTLDLCEDLLASDERVGKILARLKQSLFGRGLYRVGLRRHYMHLCAMLSVLGVLRRHVRLDQILKGNGFFGRAVGMLKILFNLALGRKGAVYDRYTRIHNPLLIIILPFEDSETMESERLERCTSVFAYVDPADDQVKQVPVCAWSLFKEETMRKISDRYNMRVKDAGNDEQCSCCHGSDGASLGA